MIKHTNRTLTKVTIIIPTYNEQDSIGKIIKDIKKLNKILSLEIIVADGGSKDKTVELAKKERVKVIKFSKKRGKGADFWDAALQAKGKYTVQIDADYQFLPSEIPLLINELDRGADIAIAKRVDQGKSPIIRTFGNYILTLAVSLVTGRRIFDSLAGFKAIKTKKLHSLNLTENHFGYEAEVVIKSLRMNYKLVEVPVSYTRRNTGASQVSPLRDGFLILISILKSRFAKLEKN